MVVQLLSKSPVARPIASTRALIASILSRSAPSTSPLFTTPTAACAIRRSLICSLSSAVCVASSQHERASSIRSFSSRATSSSLNDSNPNWSNRPPKETILLDGCDFEHWLVVMEKPEGDPTRDEIIDSYIKTLAMVVGSEDEARMKIYSVSTRCYFAFGALVSEELSYKIKELPRVRWVLPDSYLNVKEKDYGGEPFINGQAVPYDPKYHEEWERNNQRAMERNRRNDRPRNNDRSRSFNRNRNMQYQDVRSTQPPQMANAGMPSNPSNPTGYPPNNPTTPPNQGGYPPNNMTLPPSQGGYPQSNMGPPPNQGGYAPNQGGYPQNNMMPPSQGGYSQNQGGYQPNNMVPPNQGGYPQSNMGPPSRGYPPNSPAQPGFSTPRMQENIQPSGGPSPNNFSMQQNHVPINTGVSSGNAGWPSAVNSRPNPPNFQHGSNPGTSYQGAQQNYQDNFSPSRDGSYE